MPHEQAAVLLLGIVWLAGLVGFLALAYWLFFRAPHAALPPARYAGG